MILGVQCPPHILGPPLYLLKINVSAVLKFGKQVYMGKSLGQQLWSFCDFQKRRELYRRLFSD